MTVACLDRLPYETDGPDGSRRFGVHVCTEPDGHDGLHHCGACWAETRATTVWGLL